MIPYLSIVMVGRNDDYGVNFMSRVNTFVRNLDRQVQTNPELLELIIVEWNPLSDRPRIKDIIPPVQNLHIRVITVPQEVHETLGASIPVLEWYGKNVGVRRSQGEYVLITNPDIIFSDPMFSMFEQKSFDADTFYRCDRFDFVGEGIEQVPIDDYMQFAIDHVFQGHLSDNRAYVIAPGTDLSDFPKSTGDRLHTNGSGDFILAKRAVFDKINGLYESAENLYHCDSYSVIRLNFNNITQRIITAPMCIFHWDHPRGSRTPWNSNLARQVGNSIGDPDWGLVDHVFEEWRNTP